MEKLAAAGAIGKFVLLRVSSLPISFGVAANFPEIFVCCHMSRIIYCLPQSSALLI
jgi:hypothetical protein